MTLFYFILFFFTKALTAQIKKKKKGKKNQKENREKSGVGVVCPFRYSTMIITARGRRKREKKITGV